MEGTERTGVQRQWEEGHCSIPNPHTPQRTSPFRKKEKLGFRFGGQRRVVSFNKGARKEWAKGPQGFALRREKTSHWLCLRLKSDQRPGQPVLGRTRKSTVLGTIVHTPCHPELRMRTCVMWGGG